MAKQKTKLTKVKKPKPHRGTVARAPLRVEAAKKQFLEHLADGKSPGTAARLTMIMRSTFYKWRKADEEFAAQWDDAVETGLDELESQVYVRGFNGDNPEDARFALQRRRYDRERPQQLAPQTVINVTLQEHVRKIMDAGLPPLEIETDYELLDDAPTNPA